VQAQLAMDIYHKQLPRLPKIVPGESTFIIWYGARMFGPPPKEGEQIIISGEYKNDAYAAQDAWRMIHAGYEVEGMYHGTVIRSEVWELSLMPKRLIESLARCYNFEPSYAGLLTMLADLYEYKGDASPKPRTMWTVIEVKLNAKRS
jgi:hypothetical protein